MTDDRQRGVATVELAFALPILLAAVGTLLFASWLGTVKTILDHGARAGARFVSIPSSPDLRSYPDQASVTEAVDEATPLLTPTTVSVEPESASPNGPVRVLVTYEVANPLALLLAPLRALGFAGDVPDALTLRSEAEVRRE
ncbi:MAG: TadE/TadG family type IV pilus assembly protein [Actinomycetota bacterium]